jgi:hypothetical protein
LGGVVGNKLRPAASNRYPPTAALLRLVTDTGDETFAAPKLNRGTFEKPVSLFDTFAVVSANEAPVSNKTILRYEIGPIFWHGAAPLY